MLLFGFSDVPVLVRFVCVLVWLVDNCVLRLWRSVKIREVALLQLVFDDPKLAVLRRLTATLSQNSHHLRAQQAGLIWEENIMCCCVQTTETNDFEENASDTEIICVLLGRKTDLYVD